MKKILISSLVALILTFNVLFSYQRAYAILPFILAAPAAAEAAYVGAMAVVFAGAAAGTVGMEYLEDNYETVRSTASETWGLMSADMKQNFLQSLEQVEAGGALAADAITSFFDKLSGVLGGGQPTTPETLLKYNNTLSGTTTTSGYTVLLVHTKAPYSFGGGSTTLNIGTAYSSATNLTTVTVGGANVGILEGNKRSIVISALEVAVGRNKNIYDLITAMRSLGLSVTGVGVYLDGNLHAGSDLPTGQLDNLRNHVDDLIKNGGVRLGLNPGALVEPWANVGGVNQRVYYDANTGTLTLPDGTPIPADQVNWRSRANGKVTVDGQDIPVVVGADGALYNPATGEKVVTRADAQANSIPLTDSIPREWEWQDTLTKNPEKDKVEDKPISIPGAIAGPTKPVAWDVLKMNAKALTTKFPFSIPWDLLRQLKVFDVGPETPVFEVNIGDYLKIGGYTIPLNFEIDLSMFDKVAAFIRWFNLILWDIGLVLLIRKLLPE